MPVIHPAAIVDPGAELDGSVEVGAYSIIGAQVRIGSGTRIGPHVVIEGRTTIGRDNRVFQFASIGAAPQDRKYGGEPTALEIGDGNTIREFVTINRGTVQDRGVTRIGNDAWIMAYVHVAHDCVLGDHVIIANSTNLAGHVAIGDWVILAGATQVHQFCKIGAHAMTGVGTVVLHDIPPYVMASGSSAAAHGINSEGLRRRGFDAARINAIRRAYRLLYKSGATLQQAREALRAWVAQGATSSGVGNEAAPGADRAGEGESLDPRARGDLVLLADFLDGVTRGIVR
ncbi:MAG: acyl-ACP--UDP-N-acetylglucosamine O-acyltransferase [Burkholderiaceae bacterium]|nr:acyl-ACP--UDP-N-acetylglucosamine O-acyltransferase [Burkholderiaceae bacterium]MEB2350748.1 acyl-ACP--UDP-N-acetylglucosamine O-acyltransferase [Burkholderiaceae bacterium]